LGLSFVAGVNRIELVIFDVDDVVVDTDAATRAAASSVEGVLGRPVSQAFAHSYQVLIAHLRGLNPPEYPPLRKRIEAWQRTLSEVKQWSRECLLAIALEDAGQAPTFERVDAAARAYWQELTEKTVVYPDALQLISTLEQRGIRYHFATNSDGFLRLDDAQRTFLYDPDDSARRKLARLHQMPKLNAQNTTVGDPVGKPHTAYYERVLQRAQANASSTLAVGDSFTADVQPFMKLGTQGVWLKRHGPLEPDAVRTLLELEPLL
jgi:FMN phosphatase YigB (HAD superfamily)